MSMTDPIADMLTRIRNGIQAGQRKVDEPRGMNVTIVTTAKTDEEGRELLSQLGMPFRHS